MDAINKDSCTIAEHHFKTKDGAFTLYVQEWGNPSGTPILYLHGGPGEGCSDKDKTLFDAKKHRVLFVDQRGSGRSTPYASTKFNSTQLLVDDLETIRKKLTVESWTIFGRSWGSTLALLYSIQYPETVNRLIVGGIFLANNEGIEWIKSENLQMFYPEVVAKSNTPLDYSNKILPSIRLDDRFTPISEEDFDAEWLNIELEYTKNNFYIEENYILDNAAKLSMPVSIVHGRYDMITPPKAAWQLHQVLPHSSLHWTIAGHSGSDRANFDVSKALLSQL